METLFLWESVASTQVLEFLKTYRTPPGADRANTLVIAEFVEQMNKGGELQEWSVALVAEGKKASIGYDFSRHVFVDTFPSRGDKQVEGRYTIGVLTDPSDEAIDLDESEWLAALAATQEQWKPDAARNRIKKPELPSGMKIREQRGKGFAGGPEAFAEGVAAPVSAIA